MPLPASMSSLHLPSPFLCSNPFPAWTDHGFSPCFEDLIFGCAANLTTLLLIAFYSFRVSVVSRKKMKQSLEFFGQTRSWRIEICPIAGIIVTMVQGLRLVLDRNAESGSLKHTWSYLLLQGLAWASTWWMLHFRYEVVITDCFLLRVWWLLRPIINLPFLYSLIASLEMLWSLDLWEEILSIAVSFFFGLLIFLMGWKYSSAKNSTNKEFPLLTDPFLHAKAFQNNKKGYLVGTSIQESLFFSWVTPLMDLGTTRQLEYEDLFALPEELDPKNCSKRLLDSWAREQDRIDSDPSFFHAIYLVYRWRYLAIGVLKFSNDVLGFLGPLLLNVIVRSVEDGSTKSITRGYWCAVGIGIVSISRAFIGTQYTFLVAKLRLQVRAGIISLIYHKALSVSLSEQSFFSSGEIQTLMSVDAERVVNLCGSLHELWSLPMQMIVALGLLYTQVKFAFVAGLIVIILLIPVNKVIASKISIASQHMMKAKDERVRKMGEILTYIRTIKMYAWENLFSNKVMESRVEEVRYLGVRKYLDAWCVYFWATTPILFSFFTFGLYSILGYPLDASTVFTSLALFNILISPLNSFPWVVNGLIEAFVSLGRMRRLLTSREIIQKTEVDSEFTDATGEESNISVYLKNASFSWAHSLQKSPSLNLKSISLAIPRGTKTLIIGEVGSGKSSLFQAILGEMRHIHGDLRSKGRFAYVSQAPWILSGTIRDNILFGKPYQKDRYESVLSACALDIDVARMIGRDLCVIGDGGFNLSGGQKGRLALARAMYQDSDIYLLDDPLSSVDARVATWLLEHAISGPLMSGKTVILSTYNVQALSVVDIVIIMENGNISWSGKTEDFKEIYCRQDNKVGLVGHYLHTKHEEKPVLIVASSKDLGGTDDKSYAEEISPARQQNAIALIDEEGRVQGAVRPRVYWVYVSFIGRTWILIIFISTTFMQISRNGNDFWLSLWVDKASIETVNTNFYLKVFIFIAVANSLFTAVRAFSFAYGGLSAAFKVHQSLLERIMATSSHFFNHNPKGRILNRFSSDQYAVDDSLPFISNILLANCFSLLGILIIFCVVQWTFLIVLIPLSYFYIGLQKYYRCTSRELRRLDSTSRSPIYSSFTEALDGSEIIRAFRTQTLFYTKNEDHVALNQRTSFSEIVASLWLSIRLQLLAAFIIFFISIMSFVGRGQKSPFSTATAGLVGLGLSYATPVVSLLSDLLSTFTETEKEMVSVERISEYMEVEGEQIHGIFEAGADWPSQGKIEFKNVTLCYELALPPALRNISFKIEGGSKVGVAGRTGAGKSSILNVLFRLAQPSSGCILIDGIDISKISLYQLRSKLAIVPQNPFIFEGTIRENVDPYGNATDQRIYEVLENCKLIDMVLSLGGLDVHISEGGENFSLGQRQLLCLARSLLKSAKILCLDECTANVDPQTSLILQNTITAECVGMTMVTIAHRIASISNVDVVFVLDHGELVEQGNPNVLLHDPTSKLSGFANAGC